MKLLFAGLVLAALTLSTGSVSLSQTPCAACSTSQEVKDRTQECKDGSVKSCYLAAAALCQCNLDAGGCGSSTQALKECVAKNRKSAEDLSR